MRHYCTLLLTVLTALAGEAESIELKDYSYSQPIPLAAYTALGDTTGLTEGSDPLKLKIDVASLKFNNQKPRIAGKSLNFLAADFENRSYANATITVDSLKNYELLLDGEQISSGTKTKLHPATHRLIIKYVTDTDDATPVIKVETEAKGMIREVTDGKRMYTLDDVMRGTRISQASMSPSGTYIIVSYTDTGEKGKTQRYQRLYDAAKGRFIATLPEYSQWMPNTDRYYSVTTDYGHGRHILVTDPATGATEILVKHLPEGNFVIGPTEDFLLYSMVREGEKEDPEIYRVIEPEDRQPGWRDRTYPAIYRFDAPVLQPLAMSKEDLSVIDISDDGGHALLMSSSRRLTKRPTTLFTLIDLNLQTLEADTIVARDGFISSAYFSPDAKQVIVTGSPEAFGRVGCTLPAEVIPSAYDYQLYSVDIDTKQVRALTRDFNPSINASAWNRYDGKIYLTATDRDLYTLHVLDPKTGDIKPIPMPENVVKGIDLSQRSPIMAVWGQSDSSPDALYTYNIKNKRTDLVDRPSEARLADVRLGTCTDWTFTNPKGEKVYARYYLPDNFDPNKKYPLIVNYYGGCTPSTRNLESRYPMHVYSSLGYVTLVINPSGATGFGQEWSSRHVSTAGQGVAEDIIAGTEQFCREMDFINPEKIGCIGASYGGFMTQYLQTVTDIFAAAISHAGISDHTSYWGEGYWGYSYSEVSMGEDLPWTNPDLYVKQSPLYRADKIHTPILFLHGDADTNVPVGESIQMFTALKLLGVDTALVQVADQNHHIIDDSKRHKWQDTIFAWFAKYLQDDPTWWESLYPSTNY